uniref:Uncharacterized protein n=1 Tax=Panagrolaimus davidi TaxID=227884 RepID=A0A914PN45_9BILA
MYFTTPSNPNIFLIGIHENQLYGFGKKKNKLCLYQKSIFDSGNWEELFIIKLDVIKSECCNGGLHVASGMNDTKIWIAAREKEFTRIFSYDIFTNEFITYKMLEEIYDEFALLNCNLCCKCLIPIIRYHGCESDLHSFIITPRRYVNEVGIFRYFFNINKSQHCLLWKKFDSFQLRSSTITSNIAVHHEGEVLFVRKKLEDGQIKTLSISDSEFQINANIPVDDLDSVGHDISFCHDNFNAIYCLTLQKRNAGCLLNVSFIDFSLSQEYIKKYCLSFCTVDSNFPPFESAPFFLSSRITPTKHPSYAGIISPCFIVFQTNDEIVTVPLRMLSLSESSYLSLRKIPEPSAADAEKVKLSTFQKIKKFFTRKTKKVKDPWMSLNFIREILGLSKNFDLK